MSQDIPPHIPDDAAPPIEGHPEKTAPPPPPKPRRRRRWPWVIGVIVLLLVLLVLLAPTILSTGPARSIVIGKVNERLNGKLAVNDWSIGWTSGVTIDSVKIEDAKGRRIAEVGSIRVRASLIGLARGKYDFGEIVIDKPGVNLEIYPDGTTSLDRLLKKQPSQPEPAGPGKHEPAPSKLPDIRAKVTINELHGTISGEGIAAPINIDPSNIVLNIPSINAPIEDNGKIVYRVGSAPASTVSFSGMVDAIENNQVDLEKLAADQQVEIANADLSAAAPFLKKSDPTMALAGVGNGSLKVKANGLKQAAVNGQLNVANFAFAGAALKGDTFKSSNVALPIDVSTSASGGETLIKIQSLKVDTDQIVIDVSGQATQEALQRVAGNKAPGSAGGIAVVVNTKDLRGLVNQLRNTLALQKDVQIDSGKLDARIDLVLANDNASVKQKLDVEASGTNAGKPVKLDPIHLDASGTLIMPAAKVPDVRDLVVNLSSVFATASGGGKSLADIDVKATVNLAKARQQVAQFMDVGALDLAGTGTVSIGSQGELTKAGGSGILSSEVILNNVVVRGLKNRPDLNQRRLALKATAVAVRGAENSKDFIERITNANVALQTDDPASPVIDFLASATNIVMASMDVSSFKIEKLAIPDLARAQQQLGAFLPPTLRFAGGSVNANVTGSYVNKTLQFDQKATLSNVTVQTVEAGKPPQTLIANETENIAAAGTVATGETTKITLNTLSAGSTNKLFSIEKSGAGPMVVELKGGAIGGNGELKISSDLKRVMDMLSATGRSPANQPAQLTSGLLATTVKLNQSAAGTDIVLDGGIDNLSVTTPQQPITNEKVTLALNAHTSQQFDAVSVKSANINSSFAQTTIDGAELDLKAAGLAMLKSAKLKVVIPDINKTMNVAAAFSPPSTQPAVAATPTTKPSPPLQINGVAAVIAEVTRDGQTTHISAPTIGVSKVSLVRGNRKFVFAKPLGVKLTADIMAGEKIENVQVQELDGDLGGLATVSMPTKISITNLSASTPSANGKIALTGALGPLMQILSVVQDADPMPYTGDYEVAQNVATDASGQVKLSGDATINKFVVLTNGKPSFTEDKIVVNNDLIADTTHKNATINNVSLDMSTSKAAGVVVKGKIADWETQRKLDGVTCDLSYDLAKIWQIVKPMLSPEQQKSYADLKVAGVSKRTFNLTGSYPANVPFNEAMKNLSGDGSLAWQQIYYSGLDIGQYELPITITNGMVATVYGNKPKAERNPKPAVCNGGSMDIGGILCDLTAKDPLLSIAKNKQLFKDVQLNKVLADSMGKVAAVIFKDPSEASGLLNVTVVECDKVPLSEAIQRNNDGRAKVTVAIKDLHLDSFVSRAVAEICQLGHEGFVGEVRDSSISYANGEMQSDIAIFLTRKGVPVPLRYTGGIGLAKLDLRNAVLSIPSELIGNRDVSRAFPQGMKVPITGTTEKYKVADIGKIIRENVGGFIGGVLGGATGGNKGQPTTSGSGEQGNPTDLGGLLQDVLGGKKKDQDQPPPQPPPPANPPKKKKK